MTDERIIELLQEIRDLQRQHIANHEEAVRNQQEAIRNQQEAIRYQRNVTRRLLLLMIPVIAVIFALVAWFFLRLAGV